MMRQPPLPPMPPMRICLNLDEIPLTQTIYEQPAPLAISNLLGQEESFMNDAVLHHNFMSMRFK
jgi:hypothetical protein